MNGLVNEPIPRRSFLAFAAVLPEVMAAQEHAHQAVRSAVPPKLEFLSASQAAEIEAMASQIIPSRDSPGAREAGAIYFIDRALVTFEKDKQKAYTDGLAWLAAQVKERFIGKTSFAELSDAQQIELLQAIDKSPFFGLVRLHTVMGFLADPEYGGNRDLVGWKWIGFEDKGAFAPPFGYYDAAAKKE
jgi:gluconate 2-dehydrogenase gamma chain